MPFSVDIGVGDVIIPSATERTIKTQLDDFDAPEIMTYSPESTIAEKPDAILMKQRRNRKMIATLFYSYGKVIDICNYLNLTFGFPATPQIICLSYMPDKFTRWKNLREME